MKSLPQKKNPPLKKLTYIGLLFAGVASFALSFGSIANAQNNEGVAIIAKVDGLIDEIIADYIEESIEVARNENALVLVLQIDSSNVVLSADRFEELSDAILNSPVEMAAWIGPSGSNARGRVGELALLTDSIGIAPGATIGRISNCSNLTRCAGLDLENRSINYQSINDGSLELGGNSKVRFLDSPTIGDLLVQLDRFESQEIKADEECIENCLVQLEPVTQVRFIRLSYLDQALHTVSSPPVAYLLFSLGLGLIVLEYYTAGIGISGVIGAISFLLGTYGLVVLPTNLWACILLLVGIFGYAIDIQTGIPRLWTIIGTVSFTIGSIFLFHSGINLSWLILLIGTASMLGGMAFALPVLVRSRFTTPTIGREWMVGETGLVVETLNPNGVIKINNSLWKARTFRATPIDTGTEIEIIGLDNLVLEVEPVGITEKA